MLITRMSLLLMFILFFGCTVTTTEVPTNTPIFKVAVPSGSIADERLQEASGIVASISNKGMFWVINDSGNAASIYLINEAGKTIHHYCIKDAVNIDWEDIAISENENGKSYLYIGDIGDNYSVRDQINLIIFEEPTFTNPIDTVISDYKSYALKYPDGPKDAETIMVDPITSKVYIISKREQNVLLYEVPESLLESEAVNLIYKNSLPFFNVTCGDISSDGQEILLKTYDSIYYWKRSDNESIPETMSRTHESVAYSPEPQGESIAWTHGGDGFYTLSEKSWAPDQVLYFYEKN